MGSSTYLSCMSERGCEFCRDDQNLHFGHVEQVASIEDRGLLLRCPRGGWLYLDPSNGVTEPTHMDADDAASLFGYDA